MGGNMMPLPHTVHAVNYIAHAPPAKDFMSMPRQVFVFYFLMIKLMKYVNIMLCASLQNSLAVA
jgi:hypothetical protein